MRVAVALPNDWIFVFDAASEFRIDVAGVQVDETAVLRIVEYEFVGVAGNARICGAEVEFNHSIPEFPAMRPALQLVIYPL